MAIPRTVRSVAVNALLLFLSPLVLLGLLEGGLALLWPQLPRFSGLFRVPNHQIGAWTARPNAIATEFSPEFGTIEVATNGRGFRDHRDYGPKPAGTFRILALGDSFTWGYGVAYEETYLRLLERRLNGNGRAPVEIVKAGIPGLGTRQEMGVLQHYGLSVEPDLVVLGFIGEDMLNNAAPNALSQIRHERSMLNVARARSMEQLEWELRHSSHLYNLLISLSQRGPGLRWFVEKKAEDSFLLRTYPEKWTRLWQTTEGLLDEMHATLAARHIPLVVFVIPQRIQLLVERFGLDGNRFEPDKPGRLLREWGGPRGVPVLDLLPRFRDAATSQELYFPIDGHINAAGAAVVADALHAFLSTRMN